MCKRKRESNPRHTTPQNGVLSYAKAIYVVFFENSFFEKVTKKRR